MKTLLALAWLFVLVGAANAGSPPDSRPVLTIDFIGLNDENAAGHARQFADTVLPGADVYTFGFHGKQKPDDLRLAQGYQRILPSDALGDRNVAANAVLDLVKGDRTVLAFDFNESIIPQQLRGDQPGWLAKVVSLIPGVGVPLAAALGVAKTLPNKIQNPAMVAALAAERWISRHPDGVLVLRGHSDGTYAAGYIYDYLQSRGIRPAAVILESPRQTYDTWAQRAKSNPQTRFISVTSQNDLSRVTLFDKGYRHAGKLDNWVNYDIGGNRNPLAAHSIVTEYRKPLDINRTDRFGATGPVVAILGGLMAREMQSVLNVRPRPEAKGEQTLGPGRGSPIRIPEPSHSAATAGGRGTAQIVGGIAPDASTAMQHGEMPVVDAVVVDPVTGRLVLLTKGTAAGMAPVDPSTFAFALWSVYTGKRIAFSLDPIDRNPNGQWLRAVHYPEETAGLGLPAQNAMYDGDVLLKMLQFGVKREGDRLVARPRGLLPSLPQMLEDEQGAAPEGWTRSWIVPELVELCYTDGVVRVQRMKMAVRARHQVVDPSSPTGLRDVDTDPRSVEARWARKATEMYHRIAASGEAPSWAAIAELSKALAIAHWLKQSGARVDVASLIPLLNANGAAHVAKVRAVDVTFHREESKPFDDGKVRGVRTVRHELRLFGGVDPNGRLKLTDDGRVASLREAVRSALARAPASAHFEVVDDGTHYVATALPFAVVSAPAGTVRGLSSGRILVDADGGAMPR